jgi:hypothetical protein
MMCTARSYVYLAVFCFYPVSNSPEGDNKAGQFQLHQVDVFTIVKVELVMRYYNSSERSNLNHGTRKSEVV